MVDLLTAQCSFSRHMSFVDEPFIGLLQFCFTKGATRVVRARFLKLDVKEAPLERICGLQDCSEPSVNQSLRNVSNTSL